MRKLRSGDEIIVIAGRDKGKTGTISRVMKDGRLLIDGINLVKKHQKATQKSDGTPVEGGIIEKEAPIQVSNVAILNPATGKADRVGIKFEDDKKVRVFKSNGEAI